MQKLRLALATIFGSLLACGSVAFVSVPVQAASLFSGAKDQACNGANLNDNGCDTNDRSGDKVTDIIRSVIGILSFVVGIVAVIMLIIGGIRFITSQGDGQSTAAARNTIIYAIVGIIIAALAQILVQFVIGRAAKSPPLTNPKAGETPQVDPKNPGD